jgi:hypothetical protein
VWMKLSGLAMIVLLASCSDGSSASDVSATDFEGVCAGVGRSESPAYDPSGSGIHPIRVYQGKRPFLKDESQQLPAEWNDPKRADLVELLACSERVQETFNQTCTYGKVFTNGPLVGGQSDSLNSVTLYDATYTVQVREMRTGRPVGAAFNIEAVSGGCPQVVEFDSDTEAQTQYANNAEALVEGLRVHVVPSNESATASSTS